MLFSVKAMVFSDLRKAADTLTLYWKAFKISKIVEYLVLENGPESEYLSKALSLINF